MSKLMSEYMLIDAHSQKNDFKYVILRYFNVAGADSSGKIGQNYPNPTHLIKILSRVVLGKQNEFNIFGDDYPTRDGTAIRDYIHVEDLAYAHLEALKYLLNNDKCNILNCGYGKGYTVQEVVSAMKKISGQDFTVNIKEKRPGDPAELVADNTKILSNTGWKPRFNDIEYICKTALEWEKKI